MQLIKNLKNGGFRTGLTWQS